MTLEHMEPIKKSEIHGLKNIEDDDIHVIDFEAKNFHCVEVFSHDGTLRACAKTKEEALEKVVNIYNKEHEE